METNIYINKLYLYYREPDRMESLWYSNNTEFFQILSYALRVDIHAAQRTSLNEYADYFVSFTSVFLVKGIDDLKKLLVGLSDDYFTSFMKYYFMNNLVSNDMILSIIGDESFMRECGDYKDWIEYPLMLRAKRVLTFAEPSKINEQDIIPAFLVLSDNLKEYLLSWAYEEGKLSCQGVEYFKNNFRKKYNLLYSILNK